MQKTSTYTGIPWAMLRLFRVFLIKYLLTTNKIHLYGKEDTWDSMSYILQHVSVLNEPPLGRWLLSREVKHPLTVLVYTFTDDVYIKIKRTVYISRPNRCTESYNVFIFINKYSTCLAYTNCNIHLKNVAPDVGLKSPKHVEHLLININTL